MFTKSRIVVLIDKVIKNLHSFNQLKSGSKILIAMSGGLDSSVVAALLHYAGYEAIGISMQLFDHKNNNKNVASDSKTARCCSTDDFQDARKIAFQFKIPFYVLDLQDKFLENVINPFVQCYINGQTPNPCILCNQHIKFNALIDIAKELNCDYIATGHYAKITKDINGYYHLLKADDSTKDQSYFLFTHNQYSLSKTLFPLANLNKTDVRQIAKYFNIHVAEKAESQEICFVNSNYYSYMESINKMSPCHGHIRHIHDGEILGYHSGYWRFTIGQRKGIGVAYTTPLFVTKIDVKSNTIWVGDYDDLLSSEMLINNISWCCHKPTANCITCNIKIRSRGQENEAELQILEDNKAKLNFAIPQRAITPGQAAVFYHGNEILGGGWIIS